MEQVWKDLTLSPHPATTAAASTLPAEPPLPGLPRHRFVPFLHKNGTVSKAQSDDQKSKTSYSCACSTAKIDHASKYNESAGDRKRQRLMNNRESAAKSRARKEAYTYELEAEVAYLKEENAKLRKQQQKVLVASVGGHHQKMQKLCRTLTAPF